MTDIDLKNEAMAGDIIFECPHCGKSLAIDPRGAGLTITCPDCRREVEVPQSAGAGSPVAAPATPSMDDTVLVVPDEEESPRVRKLTDSLAASQAKINRLVENLEEVRGRRTHLEKLRTDNLARFERISAELTLVQSAADRIVEVLQAAKEENRK